MADSANTRVGLQGYAYSAPVGSTVPTTPFTAWSAADADWTDLGLISADDGLTEGHNQDRSEIKAWGYDSPVRTIKTGEVTTFQLTFLETNPTVLSLYHQIAEADMTSSGAGDTQFLTLDQGNNTDPDERALGLDVVDGDKQFRIIVPRAEVTERGDIVYKNDQAVGYQMTFTALLDSSGDLTIRKMISQLAL